MLGFFDLLQCQCHVTFQTIVLAPQLGVIQPFRRALHDSSGGERAAGLGAARPAADRSSCAYLERRASRRWRIERVDAGGRAAAPAVPQ